MSQCYGVPVPFASRQPFLLPQDYVRQLSNIQNSIRHQICRIMRWASCASSTDRAEARVVVLVGKMVILNFVVTKRTRPKEKRKPEIQASSVSHGSSWVRRRMQSQLARSSSWSVAKRGMPSFRREPFTLRLFLLSCVNKQKRTFAASFLGWKRYLA